MSFPLKYAWTLQNVYCLVSFLLYRQVAENFGQNHCPWIQKVHFRLTLVATASSAPYYFFQSGTFQVKVEQLNSREFEQRRWRRRDRSEKKHVEFAETNLHFGVLQLAVCRWVRPTIISGCQTHAPTCTIGVISYNHSGYKRGVILQQTDLRILTFNTTRDKGSCTSQWVLTT